MIRLEDSTDLTSRLAVNPERPFKREITSIVKVSPEKTPFLFHTAAQELQIVSPLSCVSFDYLLDGKKVPVTYILPFPHGNRVRGASEIVGPHRSEAIATGAVPYTYFKVDKDGQIRMGSSILDQFLLAVKNSGNTYAINIIEMGKDGKFPLTEFVSFDDLEVIDAESFRNPKAILPAMGGYEKHSPMDIISPIDIGYINLRQYLSQLKSGPYKSTLVNYANEISHTAAHPQPSTMFHKLLMENIKAQQKPKKMDRPLLIAIIPLNEFNPLKVIEGEYGKDGYDLIHFGATGYNNKPKKFEELIQKFADRPVMQKFLNEIYGNGTEGLKMINELRIKYSHKPQMQAFLDLETNKRYRLLISENITMLRKLPQNGSDTRVITEDILAELDKSIAELREIVLGIAGKHGVGLRSFINPKDVGLGF